MWNIAKVWNAAKGHRPSTRASRHRGFSHPARLERLEQRLPLSATGGTTEAGNAGAGGQLMQNDGLLSLPGAASATNGTNPANPALVDVTGSATPTAINLANDALAFNNPSWVPDDRPLRLITSQHNDGLPFNINQVANTPYGIRNFELGANTMLAHSPGPRFGNNASTAQRQAAVRTAMTDLIEHPLGENEHGLAEIEHAEPPSEVAKLLTSSAEVPVQTARIAADEPATWQPASLTQGRLEPTPRLDSAAVDQTMADGLKPEPTTTDLAVEEVARQGAASDQQPVTSAIHGVAASLAMAATGAAPPSDVSSQAALALWRRQ
ncbi:MAG TPA: hypothetical protein VFI31_11840 [Pirellulales bacterium]|nr:hypothetical protein [Pirellulales bacterium]